MKTCFSDLGKSQCFNSNDKICPFSCFSCYIINCYCCCHCKCHLKSKRKITKNVTYSLISSKYNNKKISNSLKNYNKENINYNKNNDSFINRIIYNKCNNSKNINKLNNLIYLNNDILEQTKDLKNEIDSLKEKIKNEKQNLSRILKTDYDIISKKIKMNYNYNEKKDDNKEKDKDKDYNKYKDYNKNKDKEYNYNKMNIIEENKSEDLIKSINFPKKLENYIRAGNNNSIKNRNIYKKMLSNKQYFIKTEFNDIKRNKNEDDLNNIHNKENTKKININNKYLFHKSPSLYNKGKKIRYKIHTSPINNTNKEESSINSQNKYLPIKFNDYNFGVQENCIIYKRNNDRLNPKYKFDTFRPKNKLYSECHSFLGIPSNRNHYYSRSIMQYLNNINYGKNISKSKRLICFNRNNLDLKFVYSSGNFSTSYENQNRLNNFKISPLNKKIPQFLSHSRLNDNSQDYKNNKKNFHNKYSNKTKIKYLELKKNQLIKNYKQNERLDLFKNKYLNKSSSNSNSDFHNRTKELNNIKKDSRNSIFSKPYLKFLKLNPNIIKPKNYNRNLVNKNAINNNKDNNIKVDFKRIYNKTNNNRHQISPKNEIFQSKNNSTYKSNDINSFNNSSLNNNIENKSFINSMREQNLPFNKMKKENIMKSNNDLIKNKNELKNRNNNLKDEISMYTNTKYNTDINIKSEEEKPITNSNNIISQEKKESSLSKMNIYKGLSIDDEIEKYYMPDLNLNMNIDISSKTIFTIYNISNKIYILCFDLKNKKFSLRDFADFGQFEENYKLTLNSKKKEKNQRYGNLFLSKGPYLYIITGKNYDMLFIFDSIKKTMNKLCCLKNNHSNGALIDFNNDSLLCISGDFNKKVELFSISKNEWKNYLSETLIERSNCAFCILKQRFIFLMFGKNYPTDEYLNTIEYFDLYDNNSKGWKYFNYKNNNSLYKMNVCNGNAINFNDKKIIILGGYNGLEKKDEEYFIQIELGEEYNFEINNNVLEKTDRKLKDIDKNKKYYFEGGEIIIIKNENYSQNNEILYFMGFDNQLNCHTIQISNLAHDVYYF